MSAQPTPIEVFYSYADADEDLCNQLDRHLSVLQTQGLITAWYKRHHVEAGTDWARAVDSHLNTASIILFLVSSDFLCSHYCSGTEVMRAMERHEKGDARVLPVLLRSADWQGTPFEKLQALPRNGIPVTSWPNRDEAWTSIARGIRAVLQDIQSELASLPVPTWPTIWNIPYPRNPFFTGRDKLLTRLSTAFKTGRAMALSQAQAISGLGGIGKTQIAIEYAYRHRSDYEAVLWVLSDTRESLVSGYITLAKLLGLPEKEAQDQQIIIQAVILWLQTHGSWLLILDNADDLMMVREFIPTRVGGHLLLTTRAQSTGRLANGIEVDPMTPDTGALFLFRRAGLVAKDTSLDTASSTNMAEARSICEELGGLPLALDQAGAYIEESGCSLEDYSHLYRRYRTELLRLRGGLVDDHREPVATTWSISFAKVEERSPAAADLLCFCAFLAPDAIPEEMITRSTGHFESPLQQVASDALLLNAAIAALGAYSLIRRNPSGQTLSIHRLVQAFLRDTMDKQTGRQWAERAVYAVNEVFPKVEFNTWSQCERYLPHALLCAELIEQEDLSSLKGASLLYRVGWYLYERGRYSEAEPLYKRALSIREQQLGIDHTDVAANLNNLGLLYWQQGKYEEAEPLFIRALLIREQKLGEMHPDTAESLNDLALIYRNQGKYEEAELLYKRALSICERQLGGNHPHTAICLGNLALTYKHQGKYAEAEPLLQQALTIFEQQLGTQHPHTATGLVALADLYRGMKEYERAKPLFKQALLIREQELGLSHPHTQDIRRRYISLLKEMGRDEEATALEQQGQSSSEEN